jgi:hypothetical protein
MWVQNLVRVVANWLNQFVKDSATGAIDTEPTFASSETPGGVVAPEWKNYPTTPTTQPELQPNGDIPALSLYDYDMALGKWLDNEPKPYPLSNGEFVIDRAMYENPERTWGQYVAIRTASGKLGPTP